MSSQHRGPMAAFVVVAVACLVVLVQAIRGDASGLLRPSPSEWSKLSGHIFDRLPSSLLAADSAEDHHGEDHHGEDHHGDDRGGHVDDAAGVRTAEHVAGSSASHVPTAITIASPAHEHHKGAKAAGGARQHGIRAPHHAQPGQQAPTPHGDDGEHGNRHGHGAPVDVSVSLHGHGHGKNHVTGHTSDAPDYSQSIRLAMPSYAARSPELLPGWERHDHGRGHGHDHGLQHDLGLQHGHRHVSHHSGWFRDRVDSSHGHHGRHGHH